MKRILLLVPTIFGKAGDTVTIEDDYADRLLRTRSAIKPAHRGKPKRKTQEVDAHDEPCRPD